MKPKFLCFPNKGEQRFLAASGKQAPAALKLVLFSGFASPLLRNAVYSSKDDQTNIFEQFQLKKLCGT